jgi:DNA-binding IclR family transcriptional regulator
MSEPMQSSWDRLQSLLESLTPGDEIRLAAAARDTGLSPSTCETVLDALTRVDLFTRVGDHTFVRRRMESSQ